jgi:lipopolysaccharide export system protein LptA
MKGKILFIVLLVTVLLASSSFAVAMPIIRSDKSYFDVNTGLNVLKGNVYIEVGNRVITCDQARVSVGTLEVWGSGGVTVTQDDIYFNGNNVYIYGSQDRAQIDGGVTFTRNGLSITANRAEYNWRTKLGVFSGNVTITQGGNTWTADTVTYNVETNTVIQ